MRSSRKLRARNVRLRRLIGDSQYSSKNVRALVDEFVIPYTSNQKGVGVLRVDARAENMG